MVTRKGRIKNTFRSAVFLITFFLSAPALCYPLNIWVMPNEPAINEPGRSAGEITAFIDELKETHGIIIENGVQDFLQPGNVDYALPIVSNIIGKNQFIEELKKFKNKERTDEPISLRFIRWSDAFDRLAAAVSAMPADQQPDVVQIGSTWVPSFARDDAIEDLSGKFAENDFFKPAIASAHPSGMEGLYAVPWFLDARLFYYNRNMISEDTIADWEKLKNECPKILAQNPHLKGVVGIQLAMTWNLLHNLAPQLWAFGGDIIRARFAGPLPVHDVLLDSKESVAAIKFLRDLSADRCLYFEEVNAETMEQRFLNKEVAAITQVTQFVHRLPKGWEKDFGISLPPAGPNGSVPFVGGSHLAVWHAAKDRKNFERAISLISFLTDVGSQERFIPKTGFLPARRRVLDSHFESPSLDVFANALDKGMSYPPIAEWGPIVENEFIRGHIWNIWHGIAQAESMEVLEGSIKNAASSLRKKVALNIFDKNKYKGLFALGIIIGAGGLLIIRSRRRYGFLEGKLTELENELIGIEGNRTALHGQILILEKKEKRQSDKIAVLRRKLSDLGGKAHDLSQRLGSLQEKRRDAIGPMIGEVRVMADGRMLLDDKEVIFENANQAHRLIEHLSRQMVNGSQTVSCLWGYPLFGWDAKKLQSPPNRLFNTAVAKINSALTRRKRPPLFKSEGKNSWRWRFMWDEKHFLENCDVSAALKNVRTAQDALTAGDENGSLRLALDALIIDPKCLDAVRLIASLHVKPGSEFAKMQSDIIMALDEEARGLERGAQEIGSLMKGTDHGKLTELFEHEANAMKHKAGHLGLCVKGLCGGDRRKEKPLHLTDILCRLSNIRSNIASLRAEGLAEKGVWATIVHDEKFTGLLAIPKVQSMVNRFYNHETRSFEDPRLVQLALVLMLSEPGHLSPLENATTDEEFFKGFERQLVRQFKALEEHISLLPAN